MRRSVGRRPCIKLGPAFGSPQLLERLTQHFIVGEDPTVHQSITILGERGINIGMWTLIHSVIDNSSSTSKSQPAKISIRLEAHHLTLTRNSITLMHTVDSSSSRGAGRVSLSRSLVFCVAAFS